MKISQLILPAMIACTSPALAKDHVTVFPVEVSEVKLQDYREYGEYYGTIEGFDEADLTTIGGGQVEAIEIRSGAEVKKGDRLCDIDGRIYSTRFESARLAEKIALKDYQRLQRHLKNGNASQTQADKSKLKWLQSKNDLLQAEKSMEGAFCISPVDGIVTAVSIRKFDNLGPGSPTISVANISKVKLKVGLPESEVSVYERGRPVQVLLGSQPDREWSGVVDSLTQKINKENRTFTAEVHVENTDLMLKPGLTVRARILR